MYYFKLKRTNVRYSTFNCAQLWWFIVKLFYGFPLNIAAKVNVIRAAAMGDVETVKQGLTAPRHRLCGQVLHVLEKTANNGHDNICQLILNSGAAPNSSLALILNRTFMKNHLSTAQPTFNHGHIDVNSRTEALLSACVNGHTWIVKWLMSDVMQLSSSVCITWLLTAACASSDMSIVKQLAALVDGGVTCVMSQALRIAWL